MLLAAPRLAPFDYQRFILVVTCWGWLKSLAHKSFWSTRWLISVTGVTLLVLLFCQQRAHTIRYEDAIRVMAVFPRLVSRWSRTSEIRGDGPE